MPAIYLRKIDAPLKQALKSEAVLMDITIEEYCELLFRQRIPVADQKRVIKPFEDMKHRKGGKK
jgi:hypothetical protein